MDQTLQSLLMNGTETTDSPAGSSQDALQTLLASQIKDPLMASMFNAMLQSNAAEQASTEEPLAAYRRALKRARNRIKLLEANAESAGLLVRYFGQVFGACEECLGLEDTCTVCRGAGGPGSYQPVAEELMSWVQPALGRLNMSITHNGNGQGVLGNRHDQAEKEQNNEWS